MELLKQFARLFGYKNEQFESLNEYTYREYKVRVWLYYSSLEEADANRSLVHANTQNALNAFYSISLSFNEIVTKILTVTSNVACIAITDKEGNGVSYYPDWH